MDKAELRSRMIEARGALTSQYVCDSSEKVRTRLIGLPVIQAAKTVLLYSDFQNEIKTGALAGWLLYQGKRVFLPVQGGEELRIADLSSAPLEFGRWGIAQPSERLAHYAKPEEMDVALVPGLAFDRQGNRVGFGKGYYDGLLAKAPGIFKIGLCFDFQVVERILTEPHDIGMNAVATPSALYKGEQI
jgi:5-formyltetrahydrofolate cyclo-ligase